MITIDHRGILVQSGVESNREKRVWSWRRTQMIGKYADIKRKRVTNACWSPAENGCWCARYLRMRPWLHIYLMIESFRLLSPDFFNRLVILYILNMYLSSLLYKTSNKNVYCMYVVLYCQGAYFCNQTPAYGPSSSSFDVTLTRLTVAAGIPSSNALSRCFVSFPRLMIILNCEVPSVYAMVKSCGS